MGTQPADSPESQGGEPDAEVPLVGEGEPEEPPAQAVDDAASETSPEPRESDSEQASAGEPATETAPAEPETGGEGDFERTLEGAWVLQLGSFGDEDNARRLRDNVRDRGYGAHLQEVDRDGQKLVRVFSGPFAEKEEAEKAKGVLDKAFGVKALVTKGEG